MRAVASSVWAAASFRKMASLAVPHERRRAPCHGDSSEQLLGMGRTRWGPGYSSPLPSPALVAAPALRVSCAGRQRSSGRQPWRAALEIEED